MSVMSDSNFKELRPRPSLKTAKANLNSPGDLPNCRGQFISKATVKGTVYHFRVIVVVNDVDNLVSRGVVSHMNLMAKLDAVTYGVGCLKTEPVRIILKEDAQTSAVTVARIVSIPMLPKVKDELERLKGALYRICCGVNRLGDSGVNRLGDTSAFVIPAGQLLLTRRGKTRIYTVGIVFELYTVPL